MKKLIIGGCGFVGSNLSRILLDKGYSVIVYDNLKYGFYENINELDIEFIEGDINEPDILKNYLMDIDIVFFLATVNIIAAEEDYQKCIDTNVSGLNKILDLIKDYKNIKRFVYTSTSSIYGNNSNIKENSKKDFLNIYAATKYSGECLCQLYQNKYNIPVTIVRYTNIFGPNHWPDYKYCGVIGKFIGSALKNENLKINGDGNQTRDFIYVDDACEITILASLSNKTINCDINVGYGVSYSIKYIAEIIIKMTNSKSKILQTNKRKIDNIINRRLNISKINNKLKYKNKFDIISGIEKTIQWQLTIKK